MNSVDLKTEMILAIEDSNALKLLIYDLFKNKLQLIEPVYGGGYRTLQKEEILERVGWDKK